VATAVETDAKQCAILVSLSPLAKEQLDFRLGENLRLSVSVNDKNLKVVEDVYCLQLYKH
jgi:hypothetical protein